MSLKTLLSLASTRWVERSRAVVGGLALRLPCRRQQGPTTTSAHHSSEPLEFGRDLLVSDLVRLYELQLLATSALHDLSTEDARQRSARALTDFFFELCQLADPQLFVEAGAQSADSSLNVRRLVPTARVVAFEANPYNAAFYAAKVDYGAHGVEYVNRALGDRQGQAEFYVQKSIHGVPQPRETGRNSLLRRIDPEISYDVVTVPVTTLDDELPDKVLNCLWVDVEGATRQVLAGASQMLHLTQAAIVEVEDAPYWEGQWLASSVLEFLWRHGLVPVARDFEYEYQYNIVLVNREMLTQAAVRRKLQQFYGVLRLNTSCTNPSGGGSRDGT